MKNPGPLRSVAKALLLLACLHPALALAAEPFNTATVTRVENKVSYGQVRAGRSRTRPAGPQDVVNESDFLLSEIDSRAELKYQDGSLVRIGQNTVFTFDANTRTLELGKGTFVFFVPKGAGGATIKTPSLTAAITGTVGGGSVHALPGGGFVVTLICREGSLKILPAGPIVNAGQFFRLNGDGTTAFGDFDEAKLEGKLWTFNGPLLVREFNRGENAFSLFDLRTFDPANLPSGIHQFFPTLPVAPILTSEPVSPTTPPRGGGGNGGGGETPF